MSSRFDLPTEQPAGSSKPDPYLEAASVTMRYRVGGWGDADFVTALADATVEIVPGRSVGVVGESGSGKTTLLRLLLLLEGGIA